MLIGSITQAWWCVHRQRVELQPGTRSNQESSYSTHYAALNDATYLSSAIAAHTTFVSSQATQHLHEHSI